LFLGEQVQSTPNAEARLLPISLRANQHPFQKTITEHDLPKLDNLIDVFPREFLIINWRQHSAPRIKT
jgi:hypothetical protein